MIIDLTEARLRQTQPNPFSLFHNWFGHIGSVNGLKGAKEGKKGLKKVAWKKKGFDSFSLGRGGRGKKEIDAGLKSQVPHRASRCSLAWMGWMASGERERLALLSLSFRPKEEEYFWVTGTNR